MLQRDLTPEEIARQMQCAAGIQKLRQETGFQPVANLNFSGLVSVFTDNQIAALMKLLLPTLDVEPIDGWTPPQKDSPNASV